MKMIRTRQQQGGPVPRRCLLRKSSGSGKLVSRRQMVCLAGLAKAQISDDLCMAFIQEQVVLLALDREA